MYSTSSLIEKLEYAHLSNAVLNGTGIQKFEAHVLLLEAAEEIKKLLAAADQPRN